MTTEHTIAEVRLLLGEVLSHDSDFDAFCVDYFPDTCAKFSTGMDRTAKTNLLLTIERTDEIFSKLKKTHPERLKVALSRISRAAVWEDSSGDSILLLTATNQMAISDRKTLEDTANSRNVPRHRISQSEATTEQLIAQLSLGFSILHVEANINGDFIHFDDKKLSSRQFRDLLHAHHHNVRLVVLSACQSFQVGKALETSGISASLVATSNLAVETSSSFYRRFYGYLFRGLSLSDSFARSRAEQYAVYGNEAAEIFVLSVYDMNTPLFFKWHS